MKCVVVGAGISGLALAHELVRRGVETLVLEGANRPGGVIRSERAGGYLCESGAAGLTLRDGSPAADLIRELGLGDRVVRAWPAAKNRLVAADGRVAALPETALDFLRTPLLSRPAKLRALADLLLPRGGKPDESVARLATRRLGRAAAERLVFPLLSGLYAGDPERISVRHAFPWLVAAERTHRSLGVAMVRRALPQSGGSLVSLRDGVEEITRALAHRLAPELLLGAPVHAIRRDGSGFRVSAQGIEVRADAVALAAPAHASANLVATLDPGLASTLASIRYVPVVVVHLGYPAAAFAGRDAAYGFFVPPSEPAWLLGAVFESQVFPGRAPVGEVLVMARLGGARHPDLVRLPETALCKLAEDELARLLGLSVRPRFVRVVRHDRGLPQYEVGHSARLHEIEAAEARHPGLYLTGSAYRGPSVPECIASARVVADRICSFRGEARASSRTSPAGYAGRR